MWQSTQLHLVLRIDSIKVISFDKFNIQNKPAIDFEEQVRKHLDFSLHFHFKKHIVQMINANEKECIEKANDIKDKSKSNVYSKFGSEKLNSTAIT